MRCHEFDWKGYVLGEVSAGQAAGAEEHLAGCAVCRDEVAGLRLTLVALRRLPEREVPRAIRFAPAEPPVVAPWWQRFWNSGPQLGFAAAGMLAAAILVHGFVARPVQQFDQAQIQARVDAELARRMPEAVRQAVAASAPREDKQVPAALASLSDRLDQVEKAREADLKDVRGAFGAIERKLNVMYVSAARLGGD